MGQRAKPPFQAARILLGRKFDQAKEEDVAMIGFFWFFLGLGMTIAALVMIKVSTPNEK